MAKRTDRPALRPRVVNDTILAQYLGRSVTWLTEHRPGLEKRGFPQRLPLVGGNDLDKIDAWLDGLLDRGGALALDYDRAWMKAATHGQD